MKTGKKYLITAEVPCAYCNGEGTVWDTDYAPAYPQYKKTCQSCQGSGKEYKQVPFEEALVDLGYVPMQLRDLTEEEDKKVSQFMRELFPDMHKRFYPNEEKPSEPLSVAYRGLKIIKEDNRYWTVDTSKEEEYVGCYFHFETWQKALEFVDAELRKDIPEPQF